MISIQDLFQPRHLENKYLKDFYITPFANEMNKLRDVISQLPEFFTIEGCPEKILLDKVKSWGYNFRDDASPEAIKDITLRLKTYVNKKSTISYIKDCLRYSGNSSYVSGCFFDYSEDSLDSSSYFVGPTIYDAFRWDASEYDCEHVYQDLSINRNTIKIESPSFGVSVSYLQSLDDASEYYNKYKQSLQMELESLRPLGFKFLYVNAVWATNSELEPICACDLIEETSTREVVLTTFDETPIDKTYRPSEISDKPVFTSEPTNILVNEEQLGANTKG